MKCPSCQSRFETRLIGGVEIDECSGCQGIWLDADELRQIKDGTNKDLNWVDFDLWKHSDRFRVNSNRMKCPTCTTALVAIDYDDTGVEVDFCTQCRGVWLDGGELDKIISRLSEELQNMDTSDYLRASLEEAKELVTGSESFLSEWRDLATVLRLLQYRMLTENPRLASAIAEFQAKSPI